MKAIETRYRGYKFRSRLEARWAVFFDALGLDWEYEPEGYDLENGSSYLPDFVLRDNGQIPDIYVEVKPNKPIKGKENKKIRLFASQVMSNSGLLGFIVVRGDPMTDDLFIFGKFNDKAKSGVGGVKWFFSFYEDNEGIVEQACVKARSARFEHGETP